MGPMTESKPLARQLTVQRIGVLLHEQLAWPQLKVQRRKIGLNWYHIHTVSDGYNITPYSAPM